MQDGLVSTSLFAATFILLLPWAVLRWRQWWGNARGARLDRLFGPVRHLLFNTNALVLTEVVRTLLLFYLTPVWATIFGRFSCWGNGLSFIRILAVLLGVSGRLVILGLDLGFPVPRNSGDWMALAAGVCWAIGSVYMTRTQSAAILGQTFAYAVGSLVMSVALMAWLTPDGGAISLPPLDFELVAAFLVFALGVNLPCMTVLLWGAGQLSPGRVGILLCLEMVFGVGSAALLTDEPFGMREMLGTALIIAAVLVEVTRSAGPDTAEDGDTAGWDAGQMKPKTLHEIGRSLNSLTAALGSEAFEQRMTRFSRGNGSRTT